MRRLSKWQIRRIEKKTRATPKAPGEPVMVLLHDRKFGPCECCQQPRELTHVYSRRFYCAACAAMFNETQAENSRQKYRNDQARITKYRFDHNCHR